MTARKDKQTSTLAKWEHDLNRVIVRLAQQIGERQAIEETWNVRILDYEGLRVVWKKYFPGRELWF